MKKKPSFFYFTILKKDLTRFMPLWVIYLILGLLLAVSNILDSSYYGGAGARTLVGSLSWVSVAMCVYALLAAQLLFGELFQGRMCNAIHALPVRREGLFLTHFTAGMIIGLGPNLVIALVSMPGLGPLWFVALLWWLALALVYITFFSIAIFSMHCAGNRFAAVAIYALLNFAALVVMWFFENFYMPMLYGLEMNDAIREIFYLFSPVVYMGGKGNWLLITHSPTCPYHINTSHYGDQYRCPYIFEGFGEIWGYLIIVAVVGLLLVGASALIYRRRHMESAGDFVSFKPMGILFTLLASTGVGGVLYYIAAETYLGMFIGLVVGFFACRMLLERTIKVFHKTGWLKLAILLVVVAVSLGLTYFDAFGITRRIPDVENVESVTVADGYLADWRLEVISVERQDSQIVPTGADPYYQYSKDGMITLTEPDQIREIQQIHKLMIQEGDARKQGAEVKTVTVHYKLKNGKTMTRHYRTASNSEAMHRLQAYFNTPEVILGYKTREDMLKFLISVQCYSATDSYEITDEVWMEKLVDALFADVEAGLMENEGKHYAFELQLEYRFGPGVHGGQYLVIPNSAANTVSWLKEYEAWYRENKKTAA